MKRSFWQGFGSILCLAPSMAPLPKPKLRTPQDDLLNLQGDWERAAQKVGRRDGMSPDFERLVKDLGLK